VDFATRAIHDGSEPDPSTGAVIPPVYLTSTYVQEEVGRHKGYEYSRTANPTRTALETALASLEGGARALAFASGLAASHAVLLMLQPGDRLLMSNDVYGGTHRLASRVFAEWGLEVATCDMSSPAGFLAALAEDDTQMVWIETPTNPLLRIVDLEAVSAAATEAGAYVVVDNTFATPYLQRPLERGADIVVHSTTKYLGGHSDVVGGAVVVHDEELAGGLAFLQNAVGGVPGPLDCFLVHRGLKTLAVRMERHCANALEIARFLADRSDVVEVAYPGLESHPGHEVAARQMSAFGGMVSFRPAGGQERAEKVVAATRLFALAESLGGVESLIELPAVMTHQSVADTDLAVPPDLIRLSVGIEGVGDLIDDLAEALN
jgi:cystathionine gamma-synthase